MGKNRWVLPIIGVALALSLPTSRLSAAEIIFTENVAFVWDSIPGGFSVLGGSQLDSITVTNQINAHMLSGEKLILHMGGVPVIQGIISTLVKQSCFNDGSAKIEISPVSVVDVKVIPGNAKCTLPGTGDPPVVPKNPEIGGGGGSGGGGGGNTTTPKTPGGGGGGGGGGGAPTTPAPGVSIESASKKILGLQGRVLVLFSGKLTPTQYQSELSSIVQELIVIQNEIKLLISAETISAGSGESGTATNGTLTIYLVRGMVHPQVRTLQYKLRRAGYFSAEYSDTFGPITERAVSDFQARNKIKVTGTVNDITRDALNHY